MNELPGLGAHRNRGAYLTLIATESPGATIHGSAYPMISGGYPPFSMSVAAIYEVGRTDNPKGSTVQVSRLVEKRK
jgi:hypothetical protein